MKKIMSLFLSAAMVLGLSVCGSMNNKMWARIC